MMKQILLAGQWHQPKEIWLMLFFIPIRNHFINRSLSL